MKNTCWLCGGQTNEAQVCQKCFKMAPGQIPYTEEETRWLSKWVAEAAIEDPGELEEMMFVAEKGD